MNQSIIFIKPKWVVILYLSVFLLSGVWNFLIAPQYIFLSIIITVGAVSFQMYWAASVRAFLSGLAGNTERTKVTRSQIIFYAGIMGYSIMSLSLVVSSFGWIKGADSLLATALALGMILGNLSAFILIGVAAYTIEKSEKGNKANVLNILGSFFQIFYFPIGIWFLNPRLKKIRDQ